MAEIIINLHKRLILGTLVSVFLFFVILVPNSYSELADNELEFLEQEANNEYQKKKLEQERKVRTITFDDGGRYVGDWKHGAADGYGTFYYSSGSRYEGDWVVGLRHGQGTYTWASGDRYTGEFLNDKLTGKGILTNADGSPIRTDADGDSDFWDIVFFLGGVAIGVADIYLDSKTGSGGSGGSGGTVYTNPSKGTVYNKPSKKGKGLCSGQMASGGCSCWNPCCSWYWSSD